MNWNFEEISVRELLPQQPPFVMIDKLADFTDTSTTSSFTVRADNLFCEGGSLNACALAENMAQTCAARLGFINKYILKRSIKLGFIGAIRDMRVLRTPKEGEQLLTTVTVKQEIMGLTLVDAATRCGGDVIATAEMKIALSDIDMFN